LKQHDATQLHLLISKTSNKPEQWTVFKISMSVDPDQANTRSELMTS
jgi:hypothetical protein